MIAMRKGDRLPIPEGMDLKRPYQTYQDFATGDTIINQEYDVAGYLYVYKDGVINA